MNGYKKINVFCTNCHNEGNAGDDMYSMIADGLEDTPNNAFRPRGQIDGYPIWICNKCNEGGVWVKPGWFSKFKPLSKEGFQDLKRNWESHHGHGTF